LDWSALYGLLITGTGWTLPVVDALTMAEALDLLNYWTDFPPAHIAIRALAGTSSSAAPAERPVPIDEAGMKELVKMFG